MGLKLNGRYISLILAVQIAYLVQAVRAAGKCDAVFKGFSDCLLKLGDSMANYPQGLDDKTNIKTVCTYWEDFHSCTVTALTDCQEGAKDMWDKLRKESKNLNIQGSLFELCGSGNGAAGSLLPALSVLLVSLSAALATWLSFWARDRVPPPLTHPHSLHAPGNREEEPFVLWGRCDSLWYWKHSYGIVGNPVSLFFFLFWLSPCVLFANCYRSVSKASTAKIGPHLKSVFTQK